MKVRAIVEIMGHPKEHVADVIKQVLDKVKEGHDVKSSELFEPKEVKGMWSSFFEVIIEFKDVEQLAFFCFDYMPSSIQIEEPESVSMNNNQLNNIFNDIMAKLHMYDANSKTLHAKNVILEKKLKEALRELKKEPTS